MEKRRTFLLLVLLGVVSAWAFTIYSQRELEAASLARVAQAARLRHFAPGEAGQWLVVEPDESISQVLSLDPSSPAWLKKSAPDEAPAEAAASLSVQAGPAQDILQLRRGQQVRLVNCLLQSVFSFDIPVGQDLKHPLWLSPGRGQAVAETSGESGDITLFVGTAAGWKPLQPPDSLGLGTLRPLVGSEHFSPGWTYFGFEVREGDSGVSSVVLRLQDGHWVKLPAKGLLGMEDDGTLHLGGLEGSEDARFSSGS